MLGDMVAEILAAHADHLVRDKDDGKDYLDLFPAYQAELAPLLGIADLLHARLVPVTPSPEFVAGLKQDLSVAASQRSEAQKRQKQVSFPHRRAVLIGAAAGSVLSVAGIATAWLWRRRSMARV